MAAQSGLLLYALAAHACAAPILHPPCDLPRDAPGASETLEVCGISSTITQRDVRPLMNGDEAADHRIAVQLSSQLSASESEVARAACERPRIAMLHSDLSVLQQGFFVSPVAETTFVRLSAVEFRRWVDGEATTLRCLVETLEVGSTFENHPVDELQINFSRPYSREQIVKLFESLPGVQSVSATTLTVGERALVQVEEDAEGVINWLIRTGSGDCPSDCIHHRYFLAESQPAGAVTLLGVYDDGSGLAVPPPSWIPQDVLR